jgi:subtilase family protein
MIPSHHRSRHRGQRPPSRLRISSLLALLSFAAVSASASTPENLGNGLGKLVESHLALAGLDDVARAAATPYNGYRTAQDAALAALAIRDATDRVMVRVNPDGTQPIAALATTLASQLASFQVTSVDAKYRRVGVMDAMVSLDDVTALATAPGVRSVILELKPRVSRAKAAPASPSALPGDTLKKLGTAFDQGVVQHHVDQIDRFYNASAASDYEGSGMSIGFISNSFGDTTGPSPADDVASFDLPGAAGNPVNTQPVVVLQDDGGGSDDEGRAMVQIGYKMAPKARVAFATANFGEVGFANNIRALGGMPDFIYPPGTQQGFAADSICDDVGYYDEPYFQDGIIGQGVNDVAAFGVAYFSSAANDIGINGYDSDLRWVPNGIGMTAADGNSALTGTNIDLTGVPAELYAGGFHNFDPDVGQQDVAQTVNIATNSNEPPTVVEWNEPYDQTSEPNLVEPPVFTGNGTITNADPEVSFTVPTALTEGTLYQLDSDADTGSAVDTIVTVLDPDGNTVVDHQDTEVNETARFFAPVTGANYQIIIDRFSNTTGPFTVTLHASTGFSGATVSTRISLLVFDANGTYVPDDSLTTNALATNEPIQLGYTLRSGGSQLQYVIARANTPTGPNVATHVRYLMPGNGVGGLGPAEYFSYNTVTTGGHAMAAGGNGTAAYAVFRPSLPETFTSPGPVTIYYDTDGNRLDPPIVRQQPAIAAVDGANTSFFVSDNTLDPDTNPNFYGTSAAGPHAAAIAALVLEAHGGHHSLTPDQMTSLLKHSTFPHDLDPSAASGVARTASGDKIAIRIASDGSNNVGTGGQDANSFVVTYTGSSSLTSLVFDPAGSAMAAGNVSGGNNGEIDDASSNPATVTYFENNAPGAVFIPGTRAFTVGSASTIGAGDVTATFSNTPPPPSTSQSWTMTLTFPSGTFTEDNTLKFTVGRGEQHSAATGNGAIGPGTTIADYLADILGNGVTLPSGTVAPAGMAFSGTTADGGTFSGTLQNRIGFGYSPVDGYGLIDAATAVSATP